MKTINSSHESQLKPYMDEDFEVSEDMKSKIEKLMKFFDEHGIEYDKFNPSTVSNIDFGRKDAYPNNDQYMHIPGQHNTQRWLQAISDVYRKEQQGENRVQAIRRVTSGWNIMETFDFLNWVKFHEAGEHMKYKFAKLWYENDDLGPGYFLQIKKDPAPEPEPSATGQDIDFAREKATNDSERRHTIEKQRNKIIGRLDSAEKLLRTPDGHVFSGKEFESLLESIYQLKKKIQMVNKISSSTRLYEDMIIREANALCKRGFVKASDVLYSLAQTPAASGQQAKGTPDGEEVIAPTSPGDPAGAGNPGAPGGLPSVGPGMPQGAPSSAAPESIGNDTTPLAIEEFLSGLNKGQYSPRDKQVAEDDEFEADDSLEVIDEELLVTEAQVATPPPPPLLKDESITTSPAPAGLNPSPVPGPSSVKAPVEPKAPVDEEPLEVTEDDIPQGTAEVSTSNFDAKVDAVFADITVADVVAKLEDLSKIFKTREIPRQLNVVDMMLNGLGLASYFPSLSEAANKALESNNYISTRVEDILSKLRGAVATKDIDLKGEDNEDAGKPEVAGIKSKLKTDEDKEKARKQMRKDQEVSELENKGKETPEVEIEEDLGAPPPPPPARAPAPKPLA